MPTIAALTSFTANTQAKAAEVNANFSTIRTTVNSYAAFIDSTATITGAWTFSTAPVFTNAQTFASAVTVTSGGLTVTAGGITVTAGASAFGANVTVTGTVAATLFSGSGASLTALPSANLTGALPAISGAALTGISASNITTGTLPSAQLPATITAATTFSAGGNAVVISNQGSLRFSASAGTVGSQAAFAFNSDYVTTGAASPTAMTNAPGFSGWKWVRATNAGGLETGWIPMAIA